MSALLAGAVFSDDGLFRFHLFRQWGFVYPRILVYVMLNPSKAGGLDDEGKPIDDPTVRKCIGFAKRWGFDGISVLNLYPDIATDPADLVARASDHRYGYGGGFSREWFDREINACLCAADGTLLMHRQDCPRIRVVIAAWGNNAYGSALERRRIEVVDWLREHARERTYRIGALTKLGAPSHPLMLGYGLKRERLWP